MFFVSREQDVKPHLVLKDNETFVDVGANVGSYSLGIANDYKNKGVEIVAIEAHPENFKALLRNIQINNFRNVKTINKAVCDRKGIINLYDRCRGNRVDSDLYSLHDTMVIEQYGKYVARNFIHPDRKALQIECDSLDSILMAHKVDVMKIDIEGAEVLALKGATNTLKHLRKIIVDIHGDNFKEVNEILQRSNFDLELSKESYIIGSN
jgi:FkbM family methyltransferase